MPTKKFQFDFRIFFVGTKWRQKSDTAMPAERKIENRERKLNSIFLPTLIFSLSLSVYVCILLLSICLSTLIFSLSLCLSTSFSLSCTYAWFPFVCLSFYDSRFRCLSDSTIVKSFYFSSYILLITNSYLFWFSVCFNFPFMLLWSFLCECNCLSYRHFLSS